MKRLSWTILLWCMKIATITPFHQDISVEPETPLRNGAYFGYSMASLDNDLVISAPAGDNIGKIYNYNTKTKAMRTIHIPLERDNTDIKHDYWLGATVNNGSSFFVTCAPRVAHRSKSSNFMFSLGTCFSFTKEKILKLPDRTEDYSKFDGNSDSFGWSIDVNPLNIILIGGPALLRGSVKIHQTNFTTPYIPFNINDTAVKYNFGYSIVHGHFLSDKEITYAVSSTYGEYGEGQVSIFDSDSKIKYVIHNNGNVGSMYGAVLCAVRLEGSRSSLLIGAPTFTTDSHEYDQGAIYVYVPNYSAKATEMLVLKRVINGNSTGGYFGFSILNIGDLDADGKDEVAIGAPYEDEGKGAVYIYSGHALLTGKPWLQKINRKEFRSFGFSMALLTETYEDVCNGLAISAPLVDKVFLYQCRAYVTLNLSSEFPNLQKRKNQEYFLFDVCIHLSYPHKPKFISSEFIVKIKIAHTYAKLETDELDGSVTNRIEMIDSICINVKVFTPEEGDYEEMIKYNITADLSNPIETGTKQKFNPSQVELSDRSVRSLQGQLWAANCSREYGRCVPQLRQEPSTTISDPYVVGSTKKERFSLMILNSGEIAYNPCVILTVLGAHVLSHSPGCTRVDGTAQVICKPTKVLPNGFKWPTGDIEIDTSLATNKFDELTIQSDLYNNCNNRTDKQTYEYTYGLIYNVSGINIQGLSNPSKLITITKVDVTFGKQLHHLYTIRNDGPTDYLKAKFEILLEKRKYLSYSVNVSCQCRIIEKSETDSTIKYKYLVQELNKRKETNVYICINILPDTLDEFITDGNVTISSDLTLYLKEDIQESSVSTTLTLKSVSVPAWLIIVSILIALIILIILVFILRESGCFHRKNKQKLDNLKTFVKTQSQLQHSVEDHKQQGHDDTDCLTNATPH